MEDLKISSKKYTRREKLIILDFMHPMQFIDELVPADNYMFKFNNRNKTKCQICLKLTIKKPKRRQWRRSGAFVVNFEHITHLVLMFLLLTEKLKACVTVNFSSKIRLLQ